MIRLASAFWHGGLKNGLGTISTESGALKQALFSFGGRFEGQSGVNPEELLAAAHAACFSMALVNELGKAGLTSEKIRTAAALKLEESENGWTITHIHLDVTVKLPNAKKIQFEAAATAAKDNCPISRLLNTKITLDAKLEIGNEPEKIRQPELIPVTRQVIPQSAEEEFESQV